MAYMQSLFAETGLWTALGVTLIAGLMRGFAGFGSAMLMAPIFAILFGSAEMVVTVVAIELVVSLQLFPQVREHADWKVLTPMSIAACAAMPLGVWLLASVDKNTIVTAVSAVIVAFVVLMWTGVADSMFGMRDFQINIAGLSIPLGVPLGILVVLLAAYSLVLDFDGIKRGVTNGAPRKYAWTAAFGLMVTVVWLYLEILRLLAIIMGRR